MEICMSSSDVAAAVPSEHPAVWAPFLSVHRLRSLHGAVGTLHRGCAGQARQRGLRDLPSVEAGVRLTRDQRVQPPTTFSVACSAFIVAPVPFALPLPPPPGSPGQRPPSHIERGAFGSGSPLPGGCRGMVCSAPCTKWWCEFVLLLVRSTSRASSGICWTL